MSATATYDNVLDVNELVDKFASALKAKLSNAGPADNAPEAVRSDDLRIERRRRVLMSGKITGGHRHASIDCTIRNLTSSGACIRLDGLHQLPNQFQLFIQREGLVRDSSVVWQNNFHAGIKFSGWEHQINDTDFTDRNSVLNLVKSMGIAEH